MTQTSRARTATTGDPPTAVIYRLVTDNHICPFGIKSKDLLLRKGFHVEDHQLLTPEQAEGFKEHCHVETTPQTFINGERVGGYQDLRKRFGLSPAKAGETTYAPVIAIFATAFFMALALSWNQFETLWVPELFTWFVGISMCVLAVQKMRDLTAFTDQFVTYDQLSMHYVPYAYAYPFLEACAGIGMLAGLAPWCVAPVGLFIGLEGAYSVAKAVYVEKRDLKCACVGGDSDVPLGWVSLTENLLMVAAAVWMTYWF
jgi:glutaredoxin